jgi:hypothetical protein
VEDSHGKTGLILGRDGDPSQVANLKMLNDGDNDEKQRGKNKSDSAGSRRTES